MEAVLEAVTIGQLVADLDATLDALGSYAGPTPTDRDLLDALLAATRVEARLHTWRASLAARLHADDTAWRAHGTSVSTWLADTANLTHREAARLLNHGHDLHRFTTIASAAQAGTVLPEQADAILGVLDDLPDDLSTTVIREAQETMIGFAATYNSAELRRLTRHLLEVIDPDTAAERDAARLERDHRLAQRTRHLTFHRDHHGSILIRGSLPLAAAEPFIRIVDAYTAAEKRALDTLDPQAEYTTPAMRRADGLLAMAHHHSHAGLAPNHGGDRPRITVLLSYDTLHATATGHGLLTGHLVGSGDPVPASLLRTLLCDADLLPVVLGGPSEILDVGRTQRLVTPPIRAALEARDHGCIFPGCDKPPHDCHAHHLIPWWAGGPTSLENLVLACPHHHGIIEPGHDPTTDRWKARLGDHHTPEVIPPLRVDPHQQPRRHTRFTLPTPATP